MGRVNYIDTPQVLPFLTFIETKNLTNLSPQLLLLLFFLTLSYTPPNIVTTVVYGPVWTKFCDSITKTAFDQMFVHCILKLGEVIWTEAMRFNEVIGYLRWKDCDITLATSNFGLSVLVNVIASFLKVTGSTDLRSPNL